jgi:methylmalonyl-CoA mutase N-terminal domain/subunit
MAGSYHVEALTDRIESEAYNLICEIDEMGGALAALKTGFQQRRIHESAWKQTTDVENLNRKVIGVNHAKMDEEPEVEGQLIDPSIAEHQSKKLIQLRDDRDENESHNALSALTMAAATDENLFPLILAAVKAQCSVGEIMNAMKIEFGTWMAPSGF